MKQVWLGTGWKMNHGTRESVSYARELAGYLAQQPPTVQLFILPPFTALAQVAEILRESPVLVGAQNMHEASRGAFTGEISAPILHECGAALVELGHSERREHFGETDYTVNTKVLAALQATLIPLVCVGEPKIEREFGVAADWVRRQVKIALYNVPTVQLEHVILAYEPVWAIGESGTPATPKQVSQMHGVIRGTVAEIYGSELAQELPILYGGSVNHLNAASLLTQPDIDGLFVGRAAWRVTDFIQLIALVERVTVGRVYV
ncbi:MAG: triose-phosphate isomerase [Anaerolineae bacterium]|nr:triose-phosphate isomerase [Anaerolineae bacterium]